MANSTSMSDVLRAIKEKSASLASGTTSARDMVYIAKGMESLYGADMLMGMLESAGKPASVKEITDTTNNVELSVEDVSRDIVTIRNPNDSSRRARKEFAAANVVTSDIFKLTFNGLGPNGNGTAVFNSAGGATPSEEQVVDEFVSRINNDENWVVYTGGKTFNYTVSRASGTKADGTSGDVFLIDGVSRPAITFEKGNTYIFDVSDSSLNNYEFGFQTDTTGGAQFLTGVTQSAAPQGTSGSTLTVVVPNDAPASLWYADSDNATQADRYLMGNQVTVAAGNDFTVYERAVVASRDATTDNLILDSLYSGAKYEIDVTASTTLTSGSTATWGEVTNSAITGRDKVHRTPFVNVIVPAYGFSCVIRNEINAELRIKTSSSKDSKMLIVSPCKDDNSVKVFIACDSNEVEEVFTINGNTTPTTHKGDLEVNYGTGLGIQRLPIGQTGNVLQVKNGLPSWEAGKGQNGDDILYPTQAELDWQKVKSYDSHVELPPRTREYFSGMKTHCPWSQESYYEMHNGVYGGFWYKTNDNKIWRIGNETGYQNGDEANTRYNRVTHFPPNFKNKECLYIEAGYNWSAAVFDDGSACFAGGNGGGHLGYGNNTSTTSWSSSTRWDGSSNNTSIKKIIWAGGSESYCNGLILAEDGTLWVSGPSNRANGANASVVTWTQIANTVSTFDNVWGSAGHYPYYFAWDGTNNKMYSWGENGDGQLGQGTTNTVTVPTVISNFPSGKTPKSVHLSGVNDTDNAPRDGTTLILMTDGTVWGTGYNGYWQLSNGNSTSRNTFAQVGVSGAGVQLNGDSDAEFVERLWHTGQGSYTGYLARMKDGSTVTWGYNGTSDWMGRGNVGADNYTQEPELRTQISNVNTVLMRNGYMNATGFMIAVLTDDNKIHTNGFNYNGWGGMGDSSSTYGNVAPHGTQTTFGQWYEPFSCGVNTKFIALNGWGYSNNQGWYAMEEDGQITLCGYNGQYVTPSADATQQTYYPWKLRVGAR